MFVFGAMLQFAGVLFLKRRRKHLQKTTKSTIKRKTREPSMYAYEEWDRQAKTPTEKLSFEYDVKANKEAIVIDQPREKDDSTKASEIMTTANDNKISTTKIDTVSSLIYFSTFFLFNITFILYYVSIKNH